ncbi:hypothetical protein CYMTET_32358 [Cymbomonas tetramitiformis]|uniref:Uncharacterized protein n=1 Tax=Cymbomonas tetramitiformis TaxID=36881 RepID=A0AAE0KSA5_9CHLO|nr:hypothetical protein CYMTET_32358 [Cymbomonas tetramitiformis]
MQNASCKMQEVEEVREAARHVLSHTPKAGDQETYKHTSPWRLCPGGRAGEENWFFLTHHKLRMVLFELAKSPSPLPSALPDDFTGYHTYLPDHFPDLTVLHHAKGPRTASYLRCSTGADDGNCAPCGSCDGSGGSSKEGGDEFGGRHMGM